LPEVVKDIKGRSAAAMNKLPNNHKGKCWQAAFYDRALRKEQDRLAIARYIVANPLRARLVRRVGEYPYWNSVFL
jgi:REP element-mobilizing transposase RayT